MNKEPLYICLPEDGKKLTIIPKSEVEKNIRSMEEDFDNDISYTVLGSVKAAYKGIPFLLSYKLADKENKTTSTTMYDVIYAESGAEAHSLLLGKKRLKDYIINITNTLDLRKLIADYYE